MTARHRLAQFNLRVAIRALRESHARMTRVLVNRPAPEVP